jgi:hypothetical protein
MAQKSPIKFGSISNEELQMKECTFYKDAHAMILGEVGYLKFQHQTDKGWQTVLNVTVRKKIFTNEGKDAGSVKIQIYQPKTGGNREELITLKGYVYNLEGDKVEKIKLSEESKFETRINDNLIELSFAMPGIKNGSVVEYRYEIVSDYISNLKTWHFQSNIPVAYSEFEYTFPEYFTYQALSLGTGIPLEETSKKVEEIFLIEWREMQFGGSTEKNIVELKSNSNYRKLIAKNVPPVIEEPFMANEIDVPARVEFQLTSIKYQNEALIPIAGNYDQFNLTLLKHESFGLRLDNAFFAKEWAESVNGKDDLSKAKGIFVKAKNHFIFDGSHTIYSAKAGRNAFMAKTGSVSDINLSLVTAFREAGLTAHPIVLSTRSNGIPHPVYPNFTHYNYVVAGIIIDNKIYLADAASNMPFGRLPTKCLNGMGWMVASDYSGFVNLKEDNPYKTTTMVKTSFDSGKMKSEFSVKDEDYAAIESNTEVKRDKKSFETDMVANFDEGTISEVKYHEDNNSDAFKFEFTLEQPFDDEDIIYIQPFADGVFLENPFKREDRTTNIDFTFQRSRKAIAIINIPEGYEVEIPEGANEKLKEGAMTFKYTVVNNNNILNVVSDFRIKDTDYKATEYQLLKEFFQLMADKNNQMIVLKKIG